MKYLDSLREGMRISEVYLCKNKQIALTKAGKEYGNLILQDKTGTVDAKIWDLGSPGIGNFEAMDYVCVDADVTMFMGSNQLNVKRIRKADEGEYIPADYLPVSSRDIGKMYTELLGIVASVKNPYLRKLLESYFGDPDFAKAFRFHSAAKERSSRLCGRTSGAYAECGKDVQLFCRNLSYAQPGSAFDSGFIP